MRADDILYDIRDQQRDIIKLKDERDYLRYSLFGRAICYDSDKVQSSPTDVMCDRISEACDQDAQIRKRQKKLNQRKDLMRSYLVQLGNADQIMAIDLYYLSVTTDGRLYSWNDVARILGRSHDYVQKVLHRRAIDKLNNIL